MLTPALALIRARLDRLGVALSALCLVHCVSGVVLVGLLGVGGGVLLDPHVHEYGLMLAIAIGALGLGFGLARHGRREPLVLGSIGLVLMAGGLAVPHGLPEIAMTIPGVILLAFAHIRNLRHAA
ncbi:MerC domain-containing protein [Novosphingobium sp. KACC 22771]|uniref:MerC domain-containing protein n=1 Tax=Novosphingobium sp. KACC 22771 TaxID=3025670 RepID=UPI002365BBB3|nr:MerC domain-containing protein [Novosphingobium sp. KACC 22771]WDF72838.1 MerC domain-containing protein [Novosphingobium sp. KACC 22771]